MYTDLYLDLEWFPNQQLYLIGFAYSITQSGQLFDDSLTFQNVVEILTPVDGYIYFYGPDIGMLEKATGLNIRSNFRCVNLLRVFRDIMPGMDSYRLSHFEELYGINRSTREYKRDYRQLVNDWHDPYRKAKVLKYNLEDVVNMARLKLQVFNIYQITYDYLDNKLL